MRVALYHNLSYGGAKRVYYDAFSYLKKKYGNEILLTEFVTEYTSGGQTDLTPYLEKREIVKITPPQSKNNRLLNLLNDAAYLKKRRNTQFEIAQRINENSFDIAFVFPCRTEQTPSLLRYLNIPSIFFGAEVNRAVFEHPRIFDPTYTGGRQRGNFISRPYYEALRRNDVRNAESATRIIAISYHTKESIIKTYGIFPEVIYNGLNLDIFNHNPEIAKENAVLSVGALVPFKRHRLVAEAVALIPQADRPELWIAYHSEFAGEGKYISDFCEENNVNLKLLKGLDDKKLNEVYTRARVVALGYAVEPLGLVPLEAMACGTPVVVVKEGGFRETVADGEVGLLIDRNPQEMADAIETLFSNNTLYEKMVANCRPYVEHNWNYRDGAEKYYAIMRKVAGIG